MGRKLLEASLQHPRLANASRIFLAVWNENERAVRLYKNFGFRSVGTTGFTIGAEVMEDDVMLLDRTEADDQAERASRVVQTARNHPGVRLTALALLLVVLAGCGSHGGATIRVVPGRALLDAPVTINVTGAKAGAPVQLEARAVDAEGKVWQSSTTARADGDGRVTLRGNQAMRLLWRLAPKEDAPYIYIPKGDTFGITVSARVRGRRVEATVTRISRSPNVHTRMLTVAREGLYGEIFTAPGDSRRTGVLIRRSRSRISTRRDYLQLCTPSRSSTSLGRCASSGSSRRSTRRSSSSSAFHAAQKPRNSSAFTTHNSYTA